MERKRKIMKRFLLTFIVVGLCLTLLSCRHNGGQVTSYPLDNQDYMQRFTQIIYQLGKAIEREYCLSAPIYTASDANGCFDCHDKIR